MADDNMTTGSRQLMRGAIPSPRHTLLAARPFHSTAAPPPQFAVVPSQLSVWGNATYGDCVTAEEAFAKAAWSIMCGLPETFVTEQEVVRWANRYGFLNGAMLTDVMDVMARDGLNSGGVNEKDGGYSGVDYSNEFVLQSALVVGPVKIAIDANALPSGAGSRNGWFSVSSAHYGNTDHCVALCGYGPASYLFERLGVPIPSSLDPSRPGYLLFTWGTIGFVTHGWLMGTCTEAWVRNPTTVGQVPTPPTPVPPSPPSPPVPPVPPVPPTPPGPKVIGSVVIPDRTVPVPHWLGTVPVTIPGGTFAVTDMVVSSSASAGSPNWFSLFRDVLNLVRDVRAKDFAAIVTDLTRIAADLGFSLTPRTWNSVEATAIDWHAAETDALKLVFDFISHNDAAVGADFRKLLADFGLSVG